MKEAVYIKGDLSAWFAYQLWYKHDVSISEAAREFDVSRDAVMESFERNNPIRYKLFMARLNLALGLAGILAALHSYLKDFRNMIERSIS